jgi:hypothetical protein
MMPKWRGLLTRVDHLVLRTLLFSQRVLLWPTVYAIAWAAAIWPLVHRERFGDYVNNDLDLAERLGQLYYLLGTIGVMAVLLLGSFAVFRALQGRWRVEAWAESFNRLFAFSLAAPFLVALTQPGV